MADSAPATTTDPLNNPDPAAATTAGVGFIEADDEDEPVADDGDSALGTDAQSSTASISSSILKYREENGRTYHAYKDGKYVLPNDQREQERLDLQHHLTLLTFDDKLYLSPAGRDGHKLGHVLDIGTGTGMWAMDFADEHPETQVIGVDLSPIQSPFVPPNLTFQVDDLEEPWTFGNKFDLIYSRQMTAGIENFPRLMEQSFEYLNPGGWFEITDIGPIACDDGTMRDDHPVKRWIDLFIEGTTKINRPFDGSKHYEQQVKDAGFTNVVKVVHKWPINRWPKDPKLKELGLWSLENIDSGLEGLSVAVFTRLLGWTIEELGVLLADVRRDLRDTSLHAYWPITTVYGQKPPTN